MSPSKKVTNSLSNFTFDGIAFSNLRIGEFCLRLPRETQPGLLRAKDAAKKLMALGLEFSSMEEIIKEGVESLKSKGFIS